MRCRIFKKIKKGLDKNLCKKTMNIHSNSEYWIDNLHKNQKTLENNAPPQIRMIVEWKIYSSMMGV